jgi:hypothetical protein
MNYLSKINSKSTMDYLFKTASGWHNQGASNLVEQLTFSGNIVNVLRIEDNKAFIQTYFNDQEPPIQIIKPREKTLNPLINMFSTQYRKSLDMSTNGRYPLILVMANLGEELWIDVKEIAEL